MRRIALAVHFCRPDHCFDVGFQLTALLGGLERAVGGDICVGNLAHDVLAGSLVVVLELNVKGVEKLAGSDLLSSSHGTGRVLERLRNL